MGGCACLVVGGVRGRVEVEGDVLQKTGSCQGREEEGELQPVETPLWALFAAVPLRRRGFVQTHVHLVAPLS